MQTSLKILFAAVTIAAIGFAIVTYETPIERLQSDGAAFGQLGTGDLYLLGFPRKWDKLNPTGGIHEDDKIEAIWFPPDAELSHRDIQNLENFPNLQALNLPCKLNAKWFARINKCEKLRIVSLAGSNADDELIYVLRKHPAVLTINVAQTNVSKMAVEDFRSSSTERIVYP